MPPPPRDLSRRSAAQNRLNPGGVAEYPGDGDGGRMRPAVPLATARSSRRTARSREFSPASSSRTSRPGASDAQAWSSPGARAVPDPYERDRTHTAGLPISQP